MGRVRACVRPSVRHVAQALSHLRGGTASWLRQIMLHSVAMRCVMLSRTFRTISKVNRNKIAPSSRSIQSCTSPFKSHPSTADRAYAVSLSRTPVTTRAP